MVEKWLGLPINASLHGPQIDRIIGVIHILMFLLFFGWGIFYLYTLWRFRQSKNPKADDVGVKSHISTYLEIGVVIFEVVILVVFAFPIWSKVVVNVPDAKDATNIRIVAEQFAWNIHYPGNDGIFGKVDPKLMGPSNPLGLDSNDPNAKDDITTINQLNLPVNKPVLIRLSSKDVIHCFSLPVMRIKQDAVPGMAVPVSFTPIRTGNWEIACAQLCGLGHYRMRGYLNIQTDEEFHNWLTQQKAV